MGGLGQLCVVGRTCSLAQAGPLRSLSLQRAGSKSRCVLRPLASGAPQVAVVTEPRSNGTAHLNGYGPSNGNGFANGNGKASPAVVEPAPAVTPAVAQPATHPAGTPGHIQVATVNNPVAVFGNGAQGSVHVQALFSPKETYNVVVAVGTAKAKLPAWQTCMLAIAAGCYTAMFTSLLLMVGPNCPGLAANNPGLARYLIGAIGLPFQLMIIKICGAELFTGSTAQLTAALHEGRINLGQMLRHWCCSYAGNVLGCALGVFLLLNSGVCANLQAGISSISAAKVAIPLKQIVFRAVLANWFVCLAVWQATAAQTVGGKFISIIGPVSAFIAVGFEHCIANMVIIPLGILTGVPGVTWSGFLLNNLLPVTLGNIFAGSVCVATLYSLAFGRLGRKVNRALGVAGAH